MKLSNSECSIIEDAFYEKENTKALKRSYFLLQMALISLDNS